MDASIFSSKRKNYIEIGELYFWTATINQWQRLLWKEEYKNVVLSSLKYLVDSGKIEVFAFVIMPNHIHLIWRQNKLNGRETPKGSLLKYTGHEFLKQLKAESKSYLYQVNAANKKHEIWQRDSLGIEIYSVKVARQKLDYIHNNPVNGKWQLAHDFLSYHYSPPGFMKRVLMSLGF